MNNPIEMVQSLFAAFGRGDIDFILSHIAADAAWTAPGPSVIPSAGRYSGPAGVAEFFRKLSDSELVTRFEPREFFANGNTVVALGVEECQSRKTGKSAATNWAMSFRIDDGKVTQWETYYDTAAYALAHS